MLDSMLRLNAMKKAADELIVPAEGGDPQSE
jgi:hypothetical protein